MDIEERQMQILDRLAGVLLEDDISMGHKQDGNALIGALCILLGSCAFIKNKGKLIDCLDEVDGMKSFILDVCVDMAKGDASNDS